MTDAHSLYRIMVVGDDGTLFCYDDEVTKRDIALVFAEANTNYPTAQNIYLENMRSSKY